MLQQPPPLASAKRSADALVEASRPAAPGLGLHTEYRSEHVDPRQICCSRPNCCPELADCDAVIERPSKRAALSLKPGDHAGGHPNAEIESEQAFLDKCYETFCYECPPCASPKCAPSEVCFDPHCAQGDECADQCSDPACSKGYCPEAPCYCSKCCPLASCVGDLSAQECHINHAAPDTSGSAYCFNNAPCHFNEYNHHFTAPAYDGYQCSFGGNSALAQCNVTAQPSVQSTPALSPGTYTSLGSAFSSESSPFLGPGAVQSCLLNIPDAHCHKDNSCCHEPLQSCEQNLLLPQNQLGCGNFTTGQETKGGYGDNCFSFSYGTQQNLHPGHSTWNLSTPGYSDLHCQGNFNAQGTNPWMNQTNNRTVPILSDPGPHDKLAYLASAAQENFQDPTNALPPQQGPQEPLSASAQIKLETPFSSAPSPAPTPCQCKWELSPGHLCNEIFPNPEALHKHLKAAHVDTCTACLCQWAGCDSHSKDFKQRSKLSRHLLGHAGHRPYACSFPNCGKTFATNQAKDNHERTHTGDRPYVCPECGYNTTTHTQLYTHIAALHRKEKRHQCRFCSFTCADSSNLSKHERTHQTLRPYRCPHEGCTFKPDCRWENLKRHLKRNGHCLELLVEGSETNRRYKEGVKKEMEEWNRRNENCGGVPVARRRTSKSA